MLNMFQHVEHVPNVGNLYSSELEKEKICVESQLAVPPTDVWKLGFKKGAKKFSVSSHREHGI